MANLVPKTPPSTWVATAREVLVEEGIQGVKIDRLAQRLGVTRGGFYKHFVDRGDLLGRLLNLWETENVFVPAVSGSIGTEEARARLVGMTDRIIDELDFDPRFDMAVRDWARHDTQATAAVARVDAQRLHRLGALFRAIGCDAQEADVRARVMYYHQIGYYALGVQEAPALRRRLAPIYLRILVGDKR